MSEELVGHVLPTRTVEYAKEIDDIAKLPAEMIREIRKLKTEGKTLMEIVAALSVGKFQQYVEAVMGFDQLGHEMTEHRTVALQTIGFRTGDLVDALL